MGKAKQYTVGKDFEIQPVQDDGQVLGVLDNYLEDVVSCVWAEHPLQPEKMFQKLGRLSNESANAPQN